MNLIQYCFNFFIAQQALEMKHPLLKVRELSEASKQSKGKARRCIGKNK